MNNARNRTGVLVAVAFVGGIAVAAVVAFFLFRGTGDSDEGANATVTPIATGTPGEPAVGNSTPGSSATLTNVTDPFAAMVTFIRTDLQQTYGGACPASTSPGSTPVSGICSTDLYQSAELVTFALGSPLGGAIGELVFTKNEGSDTWTGAFIQMPPPDQSAVQLNSDAIVIGAGDCLRFRSAPGTNADVITCQIDGTRGRVIAGPQDADGQTWWQLEGLGWGSGAYLVRAPD